MSEHSGYGRFWDGEKRDPYGANEAAMQQLWYISVKNKGKHTNQDTVCNWKTHTPRMQVGRISLEYCEN